ncbi:TetR/AcrR family transcriptional regulator [Holdemania massiliensis]|uniref:TetR/AcrR family transcriptional regulator n=1 Tax=Holdemania massiliensis TaxID=1468449 RepID=UPI001F06A63C|nr:TetR/AcrR family transcriptional regulator [Holdemania massiliensis]MCH1942287.1 TetR/AcrR family transcriptional regulator [Holdemania massiliensis]
MNNEEKNTYAKNQITVITLNLLKEHPLEELTIGQIASEAQVSRNTFYRNYTTKEDIVYQYAIMLMKEFETGYNGTHKDSGTEFYQCLFQHLSDHKDFYQLLKERNLFHLVLKSIIALFGDLKKCDNISAYSVAYVAYGTYGWIEQWIERGMQESPEMIAAILEANRK